MDGKVPLSGPHESYINRVKAESICNNTSNQGSTSPTSERKLSQALLDIEKNRLLTLDREGELVLLHTYCFTDA